MKINNIALLNKINSKIDSKYHNSYVYLELLNNSINDFNELLNQLKLNNRYLDYYDINIKLSSKKPLTKNKCYNLKDIKEYIKNKWDIDEKLLDDCLNKESYLEIVGVIASKYSNKEDNYNEDIYNKIKNVINKLVNNIGNKKFLSLGDYSPKDKTITLYINNIYEYSKSNNILFEDMIKQVFIHELFHYYHYNYNDNNIELLSRNDYTSKIIKESLASYFEYEYLKYEGLDSSKELLLNSWKDNSISYYPYSGAINFLYNYEIDSNAFKNNYPFIYKKDFKNIFDKSLINMDDALRDLLPLDEFYLIKNMDSSHYSKKGIKKLLDSLDD